MIVVFTEKVIEDALRANGWYEHWHPDNWVHESSDNPDWGGRSKIEAFLHLLEYKILIDKKDERIVVVDD